MLSLVGLGVDVVAGAGAGAGAGRVMNSNVKRQNWLPISPTVGTRAVEACVIVKKWW